MIVLPDRWNNPHLLATRQVLNVGERFRSRLLSAGSALAKFA